MASRSANVNVRVEPEIKEQAEAILAELGVSVSTFINMTYRQVIFHQGIPFDVKLPDWYSPCDRMNVEELNRISLEALESEE